MSLVGDRHYEFLNILDVSVFCLLRPNPLCQSTVWKKNDNWIRKKKLKHGQETDLITVASWRTWILSSTVPKTGSSLFHEDALTQINEEWQNVFFLYLTFLFPDCCLVKRTDHQWKWKGKIPFYFLVYSDITQSKIKTANEPNGTSILIYNVNAGTALNRYIHCTQKLISIKIFNILELDRIVLLSLLIGLTYVIGTRCIITFCAYSSSSQ